MIDYIIDRLLKLEKVHPLSEEGTILYPILNTLLDAVNLKDQIGHLGIKIQLVDGIGAWVKHNPKYINIRRLTVTIFEDHPYVLKFLLAHELTHVKYGEPINNLSLGFKAFNHKYKLFNILREIRADLSAKKLIKLSDEEVNSFFNLKMQYNGDISKKKAYLMGYPNFEQRKEILLMHDEFSLELIEETVAYYCSIFEVENEVERLINEARDLLLEK